MKKRFVLLTVIIAAGILIAACSPGSEAEAVQPVERTTLLAEGRLLPVRVIDMSFTVGGQIDEVLVDDGEQVRKGDALAKLVDSAEAEAILAGAKKEALAAQQALDDYKDAAVVNLAQSQIEAILAAQTAHTNAEQLQRQRVDGIKARLDEATGEMEIAQELFERIEANGGLDPDQMNTLEAQVAATTRMWPARKKRWTRWN